MSGSLREERRRAVREALTDAAFTLFAERGFEATTVDEIAARARTGRTTLFRHFATKDDLLLAWLDDARDALAEALHAQPSDVPSLQAIRVALRSLAPVYEAHRERTLTVARLAADVPSIHARYVERKRPWEDLLAEDVAARLGVADHGDLRPRLIAQVTLAATSAATDHWLAAGGTGELTVLIDEALAAVERGFGALTKA